MRTSENNQLEQAILHMREVYFHEDDECQQQVLPKECVKHTSAELQKAKEFADAHQSPEGIGWTEMYIIQDALLKLKDLKISKIELSDVVSPILQPFDKVFTGYSSYREEAVRTIAWGGSSHCAVFANVDDDGIVTDLWSEFFYLDETDILAASKAIAAIGQLRPLIYVDWAWDYICPAEDERMFASLLRDKLEEIDGRNKE